MSMTEVTSISDTFASIPQQLRAHSQWVVWRLVQKEGKPKPDKIPFDPTNHEYASVSDSTTWGSFDQALATAAAYPQTYEGLGFVITEADPFVFIDLDDVRVTDGWNPLVTESLSKINSWAEFSQSGNGVHILAESEGVTVKTKGIEVYQYGRFVALTGKHIPGTPTEITSCQSGVDWIREEARARGGQAVKPASQPSLDPRMESLDRIGLDYTFKASGKAEMVCPWGDEHNNGDPHGAVYMPAHYNGRAHPAFFCQHATCQAAGRSNISSFDNWLSQNDSEYKTATILDAFAGAPVPSDDPEEIVVSARRPLFSDARTLLSTASSTPDWLLKGLMERGQVGLIYGDSQSLKSYICLDISGHIVSGRPWCGHKLARPGKVMFLAGEGNEGLVGRVDAMRQHHKMYAEDLANLLISSRGLDIMQDSSLLELAEAGRATGAIPDLLVIDTLSRNAILEENSAKDIADMIARCTTIAQQWRCAVLLVHHTGKGANSGARGSSALTANPDFVLRVDRTDMPGKLITSVTVEKQKSAPLPDKAITLMARTISLIGVVDEDGQTVTNLALTQVESEFANVPTKDRVSMTDREADVMSLASQYITGMQALSPSAQEAGATRRELWESYVEAKGGEVVCPVGRPQYNRTLIKLTDKGLLRAREVDGQGAWYVLPEPVGG